MGNKIIQQFDWEDRLAHYGKIATNIALIVVVLFGISKITAILDHNSVANIAEQHQNQVDYTDLGNGSAQSNTEVVSKKEIQKMLKDFGQSIQQQLKQTNSKIAEVHRLVASGVSSHSGQQADTVTTDSGSIVYKTPWDRNDMSKEYWASFTLPEKKFDVDNHIKISLSLIKAIQIDDKTVSGRHAKIYARDKVWYLEDAGSSNGTKVNGVRVTEKRLDPGDILSVARHKYEVRYIYLGDVERIYYPGSGLNKFEAMCDQGSLKLVYHNERVSIYEVVR